MNTDEIRPGMRAVGRTVFHGTRIDSFELEIIGVLHDFSPGGDLILARAEGDSLARSGIVRGMSGSPVYIGGRLIGALAYGWEFSREPMAGITPIGEMLEMLARERLPPRLSLSRPGESGLSGAPWPPAPGRENTSPSSPPEQELAALWTPVTITGFDHRGAELLRNALAPYRLAVIRGGIAGAGEDPALGEPVSLEPGAAMGVLLVTGDATAAAIGTVTMLEGDRVLGLGHPLFHNGDVDFPLATTYVHGTVPLETRSFKLASPLEIVGLVTGDRDAGVVGRIGLEADLVPLEVSVSRQGGGPSSDFRFELVRDRLLTPTLAAAMALNSLLAQEAFQAEASLSVKLEAELAGGDTLIWRDRLTSLLPPITLAVQIMRPLSLMAENPFDEARLSWIRVAVQIGPGGEWALLEEARLRREVVAPGDTLEVLLRLRPFRESPRERTTRIPLPPNIPEGSMVLRVCDADSATLWDLGRAPQSYVPRSLDRLMELIESERSHDAIYLQLGTQESGRVLSGREFPGLPSSVRSIMKAEDRSPRVTATDTRLLMELRLPMEFQVVGCHELKFEVSRRAPRR